MGIFDAFVTLSILEYKLVHVSKPHFGWYTNYYWGLEKLKAKPVSDTAADEYIDGKASLESPNDAPVRSVLNKSRSLTLVSRRRGLKKALERQCKALGTKYCAILLDMPVRWNSTSTIIDSFLSLRVLLIRHSKLRKQGRRSLIKTVQS